MTLSKPKQAEREGRHRSSIMDTLSKIRTVSASIEKEVLEINAMEADPVTRERFLERQIEKQESKIKAELKTLGDLKRALIAEREKK